MNTVTDHKATHGKIHRNAKETKNTHTYRQGYNKRNSQVEVHYIPKVKALGLKHCVLYFLIYVYVQPAVAQLEVFFSSDYL